MMKAARGKNASNNQMLFIHHSSFTIHHSSLMVLPLSLIIAALIIFLSPCLRRYVLKWPLVVSLGHSDFEELSER
jgi:hypothetical protein